MTSNDMVLSSRGMGNLVRVAPLYRATERDAPATFSDPDRSDVDSMPELVTAHGKATRTTFPIY